MQTKLSKASVEKLAYTQPGQKPQYVVSDTTQGGLMVKVGPKSRTFCVQASVKGKTRGPFSLGKFEDGVTVEDARKAARTVVEFWREGNDAAAKRIIEQAQHGQAVSVTGAAQSEPVADEQTPAASPAVTTGPPLKEALDEYLSLPGSKGGRKIKRKQSTIDDYRDILNRHTPAEWWTAPIANLNYTTVDDRHTKIGNDNGHATADKWARYLRAVYESYDRRHPLLNLPKNPVKAIDHFKPDPRRDVVTWAELPGWWTTVESLSPIRRDCWKFLLLSGLRSNAGSQIRWNEIDLDNGTLTVPADRMKGGKDFTAPLSRYVVQMLKDRKENNPKDFGGADHGYVFPTVGDDGKVKPIESINQQGYDGKGNKIRLLPGPQTLRRTFNTVATVDVKIPDAHRMILVDHSMPYSGVNGKHHYGRMSDDPIRNSLEAVTRKILEGAGQKYDEPTPDAQQGPITGPRLAS